MRKLMVSLSFLLLLAPSISAEPIVKSILRTALDPQNQSLVAGMAVRINEHSEIADDIAEAVFISYPDSSLPDLEDDFDLIVPLKDASLVGNTLFLREQTIGMVVHIALDDIMAVFPIIQSSAAFHRQSPFRPGRRIDLN